MNSSNLKNRGGSVKTDRLAAGAAVIFVAAAISIICCPVPRNMSPEALRLIAVVVLMAGLWMTQVIPLAATSLLPLILFPVLGLQTAKEVSGTYVNDLVFLYLGGFIIALGIERWGLHTRIALHIVRLVGVSPRRVVLGFMLATAGMSMWISNTASTLLMLPIGLALLKTLDVPLASPSSNQLGQKSSFGSDSQRTLQDVLAVPLLLGIAYSASLGGMTSITGTPTNYQAVGVYEEMFPDAPKLTVASWLMACLPIGILYLGLAWLVLTWKLPTGTEGQQDTKRQLRDRLTGLGSPSGAEVKMMIIFAMTAALWVFRAPLRFGRTKLLAGWSEWCPQWFETLGSSEVSSFYVAHINDSTISMLMAFVLFCVPSGTRDADGRPVRLMNWETASKLPWDVVLLVGSGFALASAFGTTGLSEWVGLALQQYLKNFPLWLIVACVCLMMTFLTEFTSNVATVSTLMPTLAALCIALKVDPRLVMVPAALATSCAFMLPIATPPNAIVFGSGKIAVKDMVRYGVLLNLIGVPVLTAATWLLIKPVLGIE
ncbi:MAG: SLC13 family permease [Fuerstiella sp.]